MRFRVSYNRVSKIVFGAFGLGSSKAWADVDADRIHARAGWAGHVTLARSSVLSVERVERAPGQLSFGVSGHSSGTWALIGSNAGIVRLLLSEPASGKVMFITMRPQVVFVSLEDPEGFIARVRPTT